jgi:hypothetical protein
MVVKIKRREKYQYMGTRPDDIKHKKGKHILVGWRFFLRVNTARETPALKLDGDFHEGNIGERKMSKHKKRYMMLLKKHTRI